MKALEKKYRRKLDKLHTKRDTAQDNGKRNKVYKLEAKIRFIEDLIELL